MEPIGISNKEELTLIDILESYLVERRLRQATEDTYRKVVDRWIDETRLERVTEIQRHHVVLWRNRILERARPETWNKYRRHLKALMNHAIELEIVEKNPFKQVPGAITDTELKKTVDLAVIQRALTLLATDPESLPPAWFWIMIIRAFFFTGVRRRQIVELRWSDFDPREGTWHIRAETSKTHREWIIPLAQPVLEDLEELRRRTEERLGHAPLPHYQIYNVTLFHRRYRGNRMTESQVSGAFQRLCRLVGDRITPHRLRHTTATLLAKERDLCALKNLLGHTNIATTMQYVHPDTEQIRCLIENLPSLSGLRSLKRKH